MIWISTAREGDVQTLLMVVKIQIVLRCRSKYVTDKFVFMGFSLLKTFGNSRKNWEIPKNVNLGLQIEQRDWTNSL